MTKAINHYQVLGLLSDVSATNLTSIEISKAYRTKALELHPDKNPNDPTANSKFQTLKSSYDIPIDPKSRKTLDDHLLRCEEDERRRRRKMMAKEEESRKRRRTVEIENKREERMSEKEREEWIWKMMPDDRVLQELAWDWKNFMDSKKKFHRY